MIDRKSKFWLAGGTALLEGAWWLLPAQNCRERVQHPHEVLWQQISPSRQHTATATAAEPWAGLQESRELV